MAHEEFIKDLDKKYFSGCDRNHFDFPKTVIEHVVKDLIEEEEFEDSNKTYVSLKSVVDYKDVKFILLKVLVELIRQKRNQDPDDKFKCNFFRILKLIKLKEAKKVRKRKLVEEINDCNEGTILLFPCNEKVVNRFNDKELARLFATCWTELLALKLNDVLIREVLKVLDTRVIPFVEKPLAMADFLIDSYNIGGSASLLALNSLFILIQNHNLEYPDFYPKLYTLFTTDLFYIKYRSRFLFLSDLFLTSSHLPSYMVAAFIKRVSRIILQAPLEVMLILIPFVANLLIRHSSLMFMINKTQSINCDNDPFDNEEPDMSKCRAFDSSLWEMKTLAENHWNEDVRKAASFINKKLPNIEFDLQDFYDKNISNYKKDTFSKIKLTSTFYSIESSKSKFLRKFI